MAQIRLFNSIEYLAGDRYLITQDVGETQIPQSLDVPANSPEWFAWLETLESFHFKGKQGYFTARHEIVKKPEENVPALRYWYAYRKTYAKQHKRYLGTTNTLTLARLEETAESLYTAVLGSLPEDEVLNKRTQSKPVPHGITLGAVTFLWDEGILKVAPSATGAQFLTQRQTAELLAYLYEHKSSILPKESTE